MNILHISQILPIPGIYKTNDFVFKLADYNLKQHPGDTVTFIRPVPYTNAILARYLQVSNISLPPGFEEYPFNKHMVKAFHFLSAWSLNNLHALLTRSIYWMNRRTVNNLVKGNHIDVVHAQFIFPDGFLALMLKKKYNIPYLITSHTELRYFSSYYSRRMAITILKNAYKITPLNFRNLEYFSGLGLKNAEVVPLGIDINFFMDYSGEKSRKEFRIITLGELIKLKNIDKVLMALSSLNKKYTLRYTIIGQGPEEEFLKKLSEKLDLQEQIDFRGFIEHEKLPQILTDHDLFILPSFPETFGRVYFEAMAAGLTVICAKNSGIFGYFPEMVDEYAVNPEDTVEIASKIEFFILNRKLCAENGKKLQSLVSAYTWEKISDRLRNFYQEARNSV